MDEPTNDELLADAIACVALDLLGLMARHGAGEAAEELRRTDH